MHIYVLDMDLKSTSLSTTAGKPQQHQRQQQQQLQRQQQEGQEEEEQQQQQQHEQSFQTAQAPLTEFRQPFALGPPMQLQGMATNLAPAPSMGFSHPLAAQRPMTTQRARQQCQKEDDDDDDDYDDEDEAEVHSRQQLHVKMQQQRQQQQQLLRAHARDTFEANAKPILRDKMRRYSQSMLDTDRHHEEPSNE